MGRRRRTRPRPDLTQNKSHHEWWWTCGVCGKRAYGTRGAAKRARDVLRGSGHTTTPALVNVYRCRGGSRAFHIGHRNPYFDGPDLNAREAG